MTEPENTADDGQWWQIIADVSEHITENYQHGAIFLAGMIFIIIVIWLWKHK